MDISIEMGHGLKWSDWNVNRSRDGTWIEVE